MNEQNEQNPSRDHHGQDGGRDALSDAQEQRLPLMAQNDAPEVEKVTGILVQTRADMGAEPRERVVQALAERLAQAGIEASSADVEELADQITIGDASTPEG